MEADKDTTINDSANRSHWLQIQHKKLKQYNGKIWIEKLNKIVKKKFKDKLNINIGLCSNKMKY